jgi:hypothetical protein
MNRFRRIAVLVLFQIALVTSSAEAIDDDASKDWEAVSVGSGTIAVPKNWRSFDKLKRSMLIYRQGDGIGIPATDENGNALQVGLMVEKFPETKETVKEMMDGLIDQAKKVRQLELVGKESVDSIKLADGTEAMFLKAEFIKEKTRRSLQLKLVVKDAESNAWIVSGHVVGGKESKLPTAESDLTRWLSAHLTSFCLDAKKFDADKVEAVYKARKEQ